MSIGGTPFNSDQLRNQLQDLQQKGFGGRQLVLDSNGASAKATLFERFCDLFTSKPSSPKQGNALQKFQAILEQDYGSVGKHVLSSLVESKKHITVNEAVTFITQAKDQLQQLMALFPQEMRGTNEIQNLARNNPVEAQRLGSAFTKMIECVNPNEAQKQVLLELVRHINIRENPKAILSFAYAATNNPRGAGLFLSNLSELVQESQLQQLSSLFKKGKIPFVECSQRFYGLSNTDPMAEAVNQIRSQLQSSRDDFARATQGAAEIAKHLITESGQLADEAFIFGLKAMIAAGKPLSGINNAFLAQQLDRLQNDPGLQAQLLAIGRNGISPVAHQAIREALGLPPNAPITAKEAQQAALAAMLAPLRQGAVGSCFATSIAINMHDTRPSEMLRDMASLIEKGFIERQNGNARIQIPFNQSMFKSPTRLKTVWVPLGGQILHSYKQERKITGNPLLRCWEYTMATSAESQLCSRKNQALWRLAGQVLDPAGTYKFMQCVNFAFDASKKVTSSADGHSSRGVFVLTYTSPQTDQKFEIQTAEQLHEALQEFSGRPLPVNSKFQTKASVFLKNLGGGHSTYILQAQYGIQNLHRATVPTFQALPDALLGIVGKIASEAKRRGVTMPLHAPMMNQRHAFNMRLDDPILQEGVRTGALESPEKRQAFLRQQLIDPMLARTLDANDVQSTSKMLRFCKDLKHHLASNVFSGAVDSVFDRVAEVLASQGRFSYADLAKATYRAMRQEFPHVPEAALQKNIMMALAPMCPKMMFADTNWEDEGHPIHWGIQFNPITEQFGIVEGMQNDSGKYDFIPPQMSESRFDNCQILDDPRVLFRT
ncbi:MAG: hypothetical protein LBB19_00185 [Puniceicoccales bacterium]|jgi:hypothetical protein|nr:hypothetical protein [Puniceicoccales bacterium]